MNDIKAGQWGGVARKPKELTLSEMIHNRRESGSPYVRGDLRACLVQREMERHAFTEEQALAEILAFTTHTGSVT
jgi:hypothetical protein